VLPEASHLLLAIFSSVCSPLVFPSTAHEQTHRYQPPRPAGNGVLERCISTPARADGHIGGIFSGISGVTEQVQTRQQVEQLNLGTWKPACWNTTQRQQQGLLQQILGQVPHRHWRTFTDVSLRNYSNNRCQALLAGRVG
jgi:hypothetical protein